MFRVKSSAGVAGWKKSFFWREVEAEIVVCQILEVRCDRSSVFMSICIKMRSAQGGQSTWLAWFSGQLTYQRGICEDFKCGTRHHEYLVVIMVSVDDE